MDTKKFYKLAKDSYNISCLIKVFIESNPYCEEMQILDTSIKLLYENLDSLYAELINEQN